ncbi:MAG: hypothetical protein AAF915_15180 [Cyanobacteria bacterium P01_D01_bin.50]
MSAIRMFILSVFATVVGALSLPFAIAQQERLEGEGESYFPEVGGRNINEEQYSLPGGFEGEYNLVLMAFTQRHQLSVNTWLDEVKSLEKKYPQLRVYELPTLPNFPQWQQQQLDNWMSAGISDAVARERTITLYTDVDAMKEALNFNNTSKIRLFLVDRNGKVYWEGEGAYSKEQFKELSEVVSSL